MSECLYTECLISFLAEKAKYLELMKKKCLSMLLQVPPKQGKHHTELTEKVDI